MKHTQWWILAVPFLIFSCLNTVMGRGAIPVMVTTLAGSDGGPGIRDGRGTTARFFFPSGIVAYKHYLYLTDTGNHTVRQYNAQSGEVITLAGEPGRRGFADGVSNKALFNFPYGIATDGTFLY
ncbi:MAG TPA: hypothetical protein ENN69_02765, partial [Spirochaetia bacterium]|nr:hypothetical protein [Spirochaetia bacterium]